MYDVVKESGKKEKSDGCISIEQAFSTFPELSIMNKFIKKSDSLFDTWGTEITMIVPHNQAFTPSLVDQLLTLDSVWTTTYLEHLTIDDSWSMNDALNESELYSVDELTTYKISTEVVQDFYGQPKEGFIISQDAQNAHHVRSVTQLCSGVLHIIDQVLLPSSLLTVIEYNNLN
eukprot:TRINITY_DN25985_c0_g1_i1.p1 TRINITY_DN25985_c0_g1~~TRINITY_DN25985_c0_g1_i1.p1  ORF type:complete len:194 (-),score=20.13 TRINITY_DN25985_c0_g1_i1:117-638(-)